MIDWNRVLELRDEVGADDFTEVVDLFVDEADEAIARLSPTIAAAQLEADFHSLKGSALNLGFDAFAQICANAERAAAANQTDGIDFGAAVDAYTQARSELMAKLDSL